MPQYYKETKQMINIFTNRIAQVIMAVAAVAVLVVGFQAFTGNDTETNTTTAATTETNSGTEANVATTPATEGNNNATIDATATEGANTVTGTTNDTTNTVAE
jgi:hypothetical protein